MCGLVGYMDLASREAADPILLEEMAECLRHRGPDSAGSFVDGATGFGFRRLSIIDLSTGDQPIYNENGDVVVVCNGVIYNYKEIQKDLEAKGHCFATNCDVEAVVHLYEEFGYDLFPRMNGQFAFALYERKEKRLVLARDPFGIAPLYYTLKNDVLIFGSEIKALLKHPLVYAEVDLIGLDQIVCFPGLISPLTMFKGISALPPGHFLVVENGAMEIRRYWDLEYPVGDGGGGELADRQIADYVEEFSAIFEGSVRRRLQADVPVGVYVSGGLDSSMVAGVMRRLRPDGELVSFAVAFEDARVTEEKYQRLMAQSADTRHHEVRFTTADVSRYFHDMIYHAECPVKETYNTCSMALSALTHAHGIKVVLGGEGADELFAGYPGYRFDAFAARSPKPPSHEEARYRLALWGDGHVGYEKTYSQFARSRQALYSDAAWNELAPRNALSQPLVDGSSLRARHVLHQRSYLDYRLRLADHLLTDHGDRMLMAHSVEGRYPFLDAEVVDFARCAPPEVKLRRLEDKYVLRQAARRFVPTSIVDREKFGFHAPGSPWLLAQNLDWVEDALSADRIRRQGYFSVDAVEALKSRMRAPGVVLDPRTDDDLLLIVLSFNVLIDRFDLPSLS